MWRTLKLLTIFNLLVLSVAEETAPGINRYASEGVRSKGYKIVYGDEDLTVLNEVVNDMMDESVLKKRSYLREDITPLQAEDVKCLMSVDRYCSKNMGKMKSVLIQAIKEDCSKCTVKEKEDAGKVISSMMAYDPVAWKLFLTRSALLLRQKNIKKIKKTMNAKKIDIEKEFRQVGNGEYVENSRNRYLMNGFNVRVKRYTLEKIPPNSTEKSYN